ncbi:uncharacterized protein KY384_009171 [Bacidia gigantensis]|uniref:uncharacterized protein n=1 Tax=Bacidia gigantensis TaxID=2732470 RepID=UPI001D058D1A|nr:uncharacterized protein KY384_009171 [Bacidia gigantensis]KAG8525527.1 hypothetical protein KY384_009171 [Bacidia gigantensis]
MAVALSTAVSTVLSLSKAAWKLGSSLSKLDQDTRIIDTTVKDLAGEVKSLGNECDLVYAELEEIATKNKTGSPSPHDIDVRTWNCLLTQVEETSRTVQDLELFVKSVRGEEFSFIGQAQRQRKLDESKDQIASIRTNVCRHSDNFRITLLLINTRLEHLTPGRTDRGFARKLDRLQDMAEKLQMSPNTESQSPISHTETTLMMCAREAIAKGTTWYEESLAAESAAGGQGAANTNIRVAEWVSTLESISWDQRRSAPSDMVSNVPSVFSGDESHTHVTSAASAQCAVQEHGTVDASGNDSEDDLETDLAKAALDTGTKAFEAQEWEEADSLLQEALRVLQQLPKQQRTFCDIFSLHYKLAVCAYHRQEPTDAEEALMSLVQQSASTNKQREYIYEAAHLLSHLYIRMGQLDRARSECEKALQARRRLLGKQSDAALESTALMAYVYILLNNRPRAKSCLAMIPEARRDAVLRIVEKSLGLKIEHPDSSPLLTRSMSEDSDIAVTRIQSRLNAPPLGLLETRCQGSVSAAVSQPPTASLLQSQHRVPSSKADLGDLQSVTVTSLSSADERSDPRAIEKGSTDVDYTTFPEALGPAVVGSGQLPEIDESFRPKTLSRKEILDKIGCRPKDAIEDAVCDGDHSAFASLLNSKKDFWRSKLRKRVRPERVTALHFAALFGEIDMARRLLSSKFNINEVPYGYSTSLTPLKFAIGARQVEMVAFLIENGAKPSDPDSWSTLAGQLMNRSWLMKTMSEAKKEFVPHQITAILQILLKQGWNVNAPFETSGATVLHQAVGFWTGSYVWDLNLRAVVTSFLYERGADPFRANRESKTPYDLASASGHQDLLLILGRGSRMKAAGNG